MDPDGKIFGDDHWPLPLPHEVGNKMSQAYMLIDTTVLEQTAVLLVGEMHRVQLWGRIYKAQGRKVIAPALEGRGFSMLGKLELQYLFWNHCKRTPPEVYAELIQQCLTQLRFIKPDDHPIADLEKQVAKLDPQEVSPHTPKEKKESAPKPEGVPPKKTSVTGIVWVLADEITAKMGRMATRQEVLEACAAEEINLSTGSTQYSKWKGSKKKGLS